MLRRRKKLLGLAVLAVAMYVGLGARESSAKEIVQYRLVEQKTVHLHDETAARTYVKTLRELGCQSTLGDHNGHFDVTYQCREWRQIEPEDHATARKWEKWLLTLGFQVEHRH